MDRWKRCDILGYLKLAGLHFFSVTQKDFLPQDSDILKEHTKKCHLMEIYFQKVINPAEEQQLGLFVFFFFLNKKATNMFL